VNLPARGEVWWCEHPDIGRRPVVVLSRDAAIRARKLTVAAPCTTTVRGLPSEVTLRAGEDPVPRDCQVNLDSIEQIPVALLVDRVGRLADARVREICAAFAVAVDS
jgi:mRNA interferase MazF